MAFFKKLIAFFTFSNEDMNDAEEIIGLFLRDPENSGLISEHLGVGFKESKKYHLKSFEDKWKKVKEMRSPAKGMISADWINYFKNHSTRMIFDMKTLREKARNRGGISDSLQHVFSAMGFVFSTLRFKPREIISSNGYMTKVFIELLKEFEAPHLKTIKPYLDKRLLEWEARIPLEETTSKNFIEFKSFIDRFVGI